MNYRHFEISINHFRQASNFVGHISKIVIEDEKGTCIVFAFAVDLMSITKHNLALAELLKKATETVKSKIDQGVFENHELTYEYNHPNFIRVDDPAWWVKNK